MRGREWVRLTTSLGFVNVFSILFGFLYSSAIARFYGAQASMDAYVVAIGLPDLLGSIILLTTLPTIITPIFAEAKEQGGEAEAWKITSQIVTFLLALGIAASAVVIFFTKELFPLLSPGLSGPTLAQAIRLTQLLFPTLVLSVLKSVLLAVLNLRGRFTLPSIIAVGAKAIETAILFMLGSRGTINLLVALVWFDGVFVAVVYWLLLPERRQLHLAWGWSPKLRSALGSAALLTLITFMGELHAYAYRWFGSFLPAGSISLYYYASRFMPVCLGFFSILIGRPILPTISMLCAREDWDSLRKEVRRAFKVALFILVPIILLFWAGRDAMLSVVFYHGRFNREDLTLLSRLFLYLLPGIAAQCAAALFSNVLFAGRWVAHQVLLVAIMVAVLYIGMAFGVVRWGLYGLAIATTVSSVITYFLSVWMVEWVTVPLFLMGDFFWFGRLTLAGLCFAGITRALAYALQISAWTRPWSFLVLMGIIFAVVYPACLHLLGGGEVRFLADELKDRVRQWFRPA